MVTTSLVRAVDLDTSRWYGGALLSFLATWRQTKGQFALFEATVPGGEEVPFHTHSREDEAFFVLDGHLTCYVGDDTLRLGAGDFVFLPRGVRHGWKAESKTLRFPVLIAPSGFEQAFLEFSEPALQKTLPPRTEPDADTLQALIRRENELGVSYEFQSGEAPEVA